MTRKYLGSFNYLFLICAFLLLVACTHDAQRKEAPVAVNGLLDLTHWNFDTDGPVKLSGEWEFYWEKILKEADLIAEPRPEGMTLIKVPGTWNGHEVSGKKISGNGYATYRLKVLLGPQKSPMAFKFLSMGTAFDIHVNGKKVSSAGVVGTTLETMTPEWLPHTAGYTPENDHMDILLHISNFNHRKGGAVEVIEFGTEKDIREMRERSLALDLFLCGSIFIIGLYHLVLFLTRKKDRASLYLGIFCLLIAVYGLLSGERYFTHLFPNTSWEFRVRLTNFTSFMSVPVFLSFIHSLFPQEFKRAFLYALGVPPILLTCAVLVTHARVYSHLIPVYHIMTLLGAIYTIYVLIFAFTRKRKGSFILLAGTCAIVITMINDVLYDNTVIRTGQFIDLGIFVFIFSQSVLLSIRFSKAFKTVESQTQELTSTNFALKQEIQMRKTMEEALRESEEKYRLITENTADLISILDLNLRFSYISPASMRFRGFTVEEAMEQTLDQVLTLDSMRLALTVFEKEMQLEASGTADPNRTRILELEEYKKDGSTIWVEVSLSFLRDKEGKPVEIVIVSRDISDRKRAEEEKRLLEERLNRAEKMEALGTLAGGVAHDLNNVLGAVVGYAELLLMDMDKADSIRPSLVDIMNGGQRAAAIVQDLLTLARRGVSSREVVNLNRIIADCQQSPEFEKLSSYHPSVSIRTDLEPNLLNIAGSSLHLAKSLYNLVSNACEAMAKGKSGIMTIKTANQYLEKPIHGYDDVREGDYVFLSVSDTGEGILEADMKRIFEPFYTKKVMGRSGTGLGLAVVWGTVKDHNGYIDVQSEEGKGSVFTLYFPVTREEITAEAIALSVTEYMGNGESVLVVDDVEGQRDLAVGMLRRLNYRASSVSSGDEAIAYLKEYQANLLVLDMIMTPGINGLETYQRVLEIHPKQKAILVSGFSETERVREAQQLGAGTYVKKPYLMEKIGVAIRDELARK